MLVGVQFFRDEANDDRVTTTIVQDGPERKPSGDFAYLAQHEVLELLNHLGLSPEQSQNFLELVLQQPPRVRRQQFELNQERETQIRVQFFPGEW
jgi:hypothetical protein